LVIVFVTFRYGEDFSAAKVRRVAEHSRAKFEDMPGLRSKVFSVLPELRQARNIYVWDDPEGPRRFFTSESRDRIAALYGVRPIIEYAEVCALVENSTILTKNAATAPKTRQRNFSRG
jgi:hypothetical protein